MKVAGHARIPPPGWEMIQAEAAISGVNAEQAARKLFEMRRLALEAEAADMLRNGFEPPIWHVCDALLGFPYCYDRTFLSALRRREDWTDKAAREEWTDRLLWEEFCGQMRKLLGYERPVKMLLIMGGNRAAKSEFAAKRCMMMLAEKENARVFAMHMSNPRSVRDQQPLFWKYMPPEWQMQTASLTTYIKYKLKTGFSESSFITPIGGSCAFLNYMQDKDTALQGIEADLVAPDELIPADWVEDLMLRMATRAGIGITTFTPVNGYTPTVKLFIESARLARTIPAYLCPEDGQAADEASALGLSATDYAELWQAEDKRRAAMSPQSAPEDVIAWLAEARGKPVKTAPAGRAFELVPRVMRCVDPRKAVVFFNPSDNPYGNPKEVIATIRNKARGYIRERFYGLAERTISVMIPRFSRKIHVVKADKIPQNGTNYFFCDPAATRNYFLSWFRKSKQNTYLYREWPGNYQIPGIGVPGPWAIPSGRNDGRNDGAPGEGQKPSFGFGLARYKFEIARLERWQDWKTWSAGGAEYPDEEELAGWDARGGADELIEERFIDSRAASAPRIENDRPETLVTFFDDLNLFFNLTPGADVTDGVSKINSALDYEDGVSAPHFFISEECENSIYALENWLNADGDKGACKDPIDLMRYCFMAGCEDIAKNSTPTRGGTSYGARQGGQGWQKGQSRFHKEERQG